MNKKELIIFFTILILFIAMMSILAIYKSRNTVEVGGIKISKTVYEDLKQSAGENGIIQICKPSGQCYYFKSTGYGDDNKLFQGPIPEGCNETFFRENGYCE